MKQRIPSLDEFNISEKNLMSDEDLKTSIEAMTPNDKFSLQYMLRGKKGNLIAPPIEFDNDSIIKRLKVHPKSEVLSKFPELFENESADFKTVELGRIEIDIINVPFYIIGAYDITKPGTNKNSQVKNIRTYIKAVGTTWWNTKIDNFLFLEWYETEEAAAKFIRREFARIKQQKIMND